MDSTVTTTANKFEIYSRGMAALNKILGIVDTEEFISLIKNDRFDYTKWQRRHFDEKTPEQISQEAKQYVTAHPYKGNPSTVI